MLPNFLRDRRRWIVIALLFLLQVVNYLDRQTLSVLAPDLRGRLGFSAQQYSWIVAAFLTAYLIGFALGGRLLDAWGVKRTLSAAVSLWSGAAMLHSAATHWIHLLCFRFLLGLGEAVGPAGGAKAIGEWTPRSERALSMSIFSNGLVTGAVLAPPLVALLAVRYGWQSAFLATGAVGFVWLAIWLKWYAPPEAHPHLTEAERSRILRGRQDPQIRNSREQSVLLSPAAWRFFVARLLTDPVPYFFTFWLPQYLSETRGFSVSWIGMIGWIPFLAADAGGLSGGALSDWLVRRGLPPARARRRMMGAAACLTPSALLAVHAQSDALSLAAVGVVLAAHSCWTANLQASITESFPAHKTGSAIGLAGVGSSIGGLLSTLATGEVVQKYGYVPVFTALAFVHGAAFLALCKPLFHRAAAVERT